MCNKFLSEIAFVLWYMKFPKIIFSSDIIFAKCVGNCKASSHLIVTKLERDNDNIAIK